MSEELLKSVSDKTVEHEYYIPIPENYKIGKTKYVIVFGTVMSGLGKGIFSSSLAKLLQFKGFNIAPIKFDGYLNIDAGTLNPYRHGEVFVLDDGTECDMDLGTYERFLDIELTKDNYLTGGKIFNNILSREREGKYLGRDVQFIPHVTGEIKLFLRNLAMKKNADIVFVEVGGTVGDIENNYFIEAMRELAYEEGRDNVCFVALTYILEPGFLGEQKSKAAQLGIRSLMGAGIQPHIIACRANNAVSQRVREKISVFSNVPVERVVSIHDVDSIYLLPSLLKDSMTDVNVLDILKLKDRVDTTKEKKAWKEWQEFTGKINSIKKEIIIGITGKYTGLRDSYASILNALEHAGIHTGIKVRIKWIETTEIEGKRLKVEQALKGVKGIIVPGGFGKRGAEGKIACIKYAREKNIPFLGLCYGLQLAVIEFARNVAGLKDANSTEINPETSCQLIDPLPEQKKLEGLGGNMRLGAQDVIIKKGALAYKLYGEKVKRRFRHRYEVNPKYVDALEKKGFVFSGKHPKYPIMQIGELPKKSFFIGSQFHPELSSRPKKPEQMFLGFIKACLK